MFRVCTTPRYMAHFKITDHSPNNHRSTTMIVLVVKSLVKTLHNIIINLCKYNIVDNMQHNRPALTYTNKPDNNPPPNLP